MGFKKGPGWEERDDKERDRERYDMAFKLAKAMQDKNRKELEKKGLSPEAIKGRLERESVGQLADFLYKMKPKELDKLIAKEKEALGQGARKSKKSLGNIGRRTASEINNTGSKFKGYLEGKRDLRKREQEKNDTKSDAKSSPRREPSSEKEGPPSGDSSQKKKNPRRERREGEAKQVGLTDPHLSQGHIQRGSAVTEREGCNFTENEL